MDKLNRYREIIERILTGIVEVTERSSDADPNLRDKTVFDRRSDNYLILREGWVGPRHINLNVVHVEIIDGKVWVQVDNTDQAIARAASRRDSEERHRVRLSTGTCQTIHGLCGCVNG
jgi:hypothetical protein